MIGIKVLQIISGNDNGGGGTHVLNIATNNENNFHCIIGCIGDGPLYDKAIKAGFDTFLIKSKSTYLGSIKKLAIQNNIDLIDYHGAKAFFAHVFNKTRKIPSASTIHSNFRHDFLNSKMKKILFTQMSLNGLKSFDYFICVSQYIKKLLIDEKFKGNKYVVNNGIDVSTIKCYKTREAIRCSYGISNNDFVFIMIARMHPVKNHLALIEAFSKLRRDTDKVKLILVGDGILETKLKNRVQELNLYKDVVFTGCREDSSDFLRASDISILTSISEGGCPPLVVLESGALKKPIICSPVGDLDKIINGTNGYLVDPGSINDIYLKMKEAYSNRSNIEQMGENLYKTVLTKFSMQNFCSNYYKIYQSIISNFYGDKKND